MRIRLALFVIGLCLLSSGCEVITMGTRNLLFEAMTSIDEWKEKHRTRRLAERAWEAALQSNPNLTEQSDDFATGFKYGFADYLQAGGTGQPPPVPPRHYWWSHYETAEGYHAIENWYDGFRQGVAAAQASGLRQWMTLPPVMSALPAPGPLPPSPPLHEVIGPAPLVPEQMPLPRKLMPEHGNGLPPLDRPGPADQQRTPPLRLPPVGPSEPPTGLPSAGKTTMLLEPRLWRVQPPQSSASWYGAPESALVLPCIYIANSRGR